MYAEECMKNWLNQGMFALERTLIDSGSLFSNIESPLLTEGVQCETPQGRGQIWFNLRNCSGTMSAAQQWNGLTLSPEMFEFR